MARSELRPEILGTPPSVGVLCNRLLVTHHYEAFVITDPANVTHLQLGNSWFQLCFEPFTVFWRLGEAPLLPVNGGNLSSGLLLNDLSDEDRIVGRLLEGIEHRANEGTTTVTLRFSGGSSLVLEHADAIGSTSLSVES